MASTVSFDMEVTETVSDTKMENADEGNESQSITMQEDG